jgi:hypothetical protein
MVATICHHILRHQHRRIHQFIFVMKVVGRGIVQTLFLRIAHVILILTRMIVVRGIVLVGIRGMGRIMFLKIYQSFLTHMVILMITKVMFNK